MIRALIYSQRIDKGELDDRSLPNALVDVKEIYHLSIKEQETD